MDGATAKENRSVATAEVLAHRFTITTTGTVMIHAASAMARGLAKTIVQPAKVQEDKEVKGYCLLSYSYSLARSIVVD